jgi:hypothetical protein
MYDDYDDEDYNDYSPEGYYDDEDDEYDSWDDYESDFWRGYTHAKLMDILEPPAPPTLSQRITAYIKNLYYRWRYPMDDIPF